MRNRHIEGGWTRGQGENFSKTRKSRDGRVPRQSHPEKPKVPEEQTVMGEIENRPRYFLPHDDVSSHADFQLPHGEEVYTVQVRGAAAELARDLQEGTYVVVSGRAAKNSYINRADLKPRRDFFATKIVVR